MGIIGRGDIEKKIFWQELPKSEEKNFFLIDAKRAFAQTRTLCGAPVTWRDSAFPTPGINLAYLLHRNSDRELESDEKFP